MFKNITIGQYIARESTVHELDPRMKIIITLILIVGLFLIGSFWGFLFMAAYIMFLIYFSRLSLPLLVRGLKPVIFIILFTLFIHILFTRGGEVLLEWRFIRVEEGGLFTGLFMATRIALLILFTSLLTLTTSPIQLTDGLETLMSPLKVVKFPAHELAMMMTIALRFIPTLLEEAEKILKAQKARGADFESGNLLRRAQNLIPLLVPLFLSAFRRADDLAAALEARCYRGGVGRTRMKELVLKRSDWLALVISLLVVVGVILI